MADLTRPYRGVSAADRQSERRAKLLDACLTVVGQNGIAATTVVAICEEARLTKRYFYESFPDLDAILIELLNGLHTSLLAEIHQELSRADGDPHVRAQIAIALLVSQMDDARMARFYTEASAHAGLHQLRQDAYGAYTALVLADVLGLSDPSPADQLDALVYVTGTTQAVIAWLAGRIDLPREQLITELTRLAVDRRTGA